MLTKDNYNQLNLCEIKTTIEKVELNVVAQQPVFDYVQKSDIEIENKSVSYIHSTTNSPDLVPIHKKDTKIMNPHLPPQPQLTKKSSVLDEYYKLIAAEKNAQSAESTTIPTENTSTMTPTATPTATTPITNATKSETSSLCYPQKENSLFWCMFISKHGYDEFQMIGNKWMNRELEEKQKIIEFIKKHPQQMKECNHKITNVMLQEIASDLMTNNKPSLLSLLAMVMYYDKNLYLYREHMYHHFCANETHSIENTILIHYDHNGQYGIDNHPTQEKIEEICSQRIKLESIHKPLRGVSAYKVGDLLSMAEILKIPQYCDYKKPELYEKILSICTWDTIQPPRKQHTKLK
jgi:hypothetical protein